MVSMQSLLLTLTLLIIARVNAAPFESVTLEQLRRATTDFAAPSGYKISWNIAGKRASVGASTKGIGYSYIASRGGVTQALVNQCASICSSTNGCGFYQIAQINGSPRGTVLCDLHSAYVASNSATYTTAPDTNSGSVVTTYAVRNLNTPVSGGSSGGSTPPTTSFPASPPGATLYQFNPSCASQYSVPLFGNNQYARSTLTSAYIVQHGSNRNFQDYFTAVYNVIGNNGIIAAPNFYVSTDSAAPSSWYQPSVNLAWGSGTGTWTIGADAVAPRAVSCSTFDIYDSLLVYFNDKGRFPNLRNIYFVSHSGGSNLVSRYSQFYDGGYNFNFRYIIENAANQAYFTSARPIANNCNDGQNFIYPYQITTQGMPRYVAGKFSAVGNNVNTIFSRWISRDVVTLIGDIDTADRYPGGTQDCGSTVQGGANRRDRNYAWWAYQNILAGTGADVSRYFGYQQLINSGARTLSQGNFRHQNCVIDGVGHDQNTMFSSNCGRAAMTQATIPAGVGPQYP